MIPVAEIKALQAEWRLRDDVIEKDYALGWFLAAIAAESTLRATWIFKGGTALRKCYYETYRFSEDLDFTVIDGELEAPEDLVPIFQRIAAWLQDRCGLEITVDAASFRRRKNRRGNPTTEGKLAFRGPRSPPSLPKLKIDITRDEVVPTEPTDRSIAHPYSDGHDWSETIRCYSIVDLLAEKLRALAERCRPRDLYDVVHIHRVLDPSLDRAAEVRASLAQKCAHAGIQVPTHASLRATPFRDEIESEWENMLAHQLPHLPPFEDFWGSLGTVFDWLNGVPAPAPLARAQLGKDLDSTWTPPRRMSTWGGTAPLELIRFAGANRLKAVINYLPERGSVGPRLVEPYSLRQTKGGNLLLFVVNDRSELRSYRVDRIMSATVTNERFVPRFLVEF